MSTDILSIVVLFVVLFLIVLSRGGKFFITLILSFYPALMLYIYFPYTGQVIATGGDPLTEFIIRIAVFAIFLVISFLAIKYFVRKHINATGGKKVVQGITLSLSALTLILSLVVVIIPLREIYSFSPLLTNFVSEETVFFWLLAPVIIMLFFVKKKIK